MTSKKMKYFSLPATVWVYTVNNRLNFPMCVLWSKKHYKIIQ